MPKHSVLTGADLHEPKGIAAVGTSGKVYASNGSQSGSWVDIDQNVIKSTGVTDVTANLFADGVGGSVWKSTGAYSEIALNLGGTLTRNFGGVTAYTDFTLTYLTEHVNNMTYNDTTKELTYTGTPDIIIAYTFCCSIKRTDTGGSPEVTIAMFQDTGAGFTEITSSRVARQFSGNDVGSMVISGLHTISNGDKLKMQIKTDAAINVQFRNVNWHTHFVSVA